MVTALARIRVTRSKCGIDVETQRYLVLYSINICHSEHETIEYVNVDRPVCDPNSLRKLLVLSIRAAYA